MPKKSEKHSFVPIPEKGAEGVDIPKNASFKVNPGGLVSYGEKLKFLDKKMDLLYLIMAAVIVALFIGFASVFATLSGVLVDTWRYNVNSYMDYEKSQKNNLADFKRIESSVNEIKKNILELKVSEKNKKQK